MSKQTGLFGKTEEPTLNIATPQKFEVRISSVGTDTFNMHFKGKIEDESALNVGLKSIELIARHTAREENTPAYLYDLACLILKNLEYDDKELFNTLKDRSVESIIKLRNSWKLVKVK